MKKISGIYKIWFTGSDQCYIGRSANLKKRKNEHLGNMRRGDRGNFLLIKAFNKYGENNFNFEVLCTGPKHCLKMLEVHYMKKYDKTYNLLDTSGGGSIRKLSSEQYIGVLRDWANLKTASYIGRKYKISSLYVSNLVNNRRYYEDVKVPKEVLQLLKDNKGKARNTSLKRKLTMEQAELIRKRYSTEKISHVNLGKEFNVCAQVIKNIVNYETYKR